MEDNPHEYGSEIVEEGFKLIEEIGLNVPPGVNVTEEAPATRTKKQLLVDPANICDRNATPIQARTLELRRRGVICIAKLPVTVGSLFRLRIDPSKTASAPVIGLCKRCTMLTEDAFETQFVTFEDLDLPELSTEFDPN